ncbi:MAG: protein regulator of cytokinesis family protein, partial [archaeon]|nr:protein regulator of cytokinesis family protein [archaeon]
MKPYNSQQPLYIGQIPQIPNYNKSSKASLIDKQRKDYSDYSGNQSQFGNNSTQNRNRRLNNKNSLPNLRVNNSFRKGFKVNENTEEEEDEFNLIQNMWDDLGVTNEYRNNFINETENLFGPEKKEYLDNELESLKKFRSNLIKLYKEREKREKTVEKLKEFDEILNTPNESNKENFSEDLFGNIENSIKDLRIHSLNVINLFINIRESTSYQVMNQKYDISEANKGYQWDKNYLLKMKNDLNFLREGEFFNYYETTDEDFDTFLMNISRSEESKDKNLRTIPIETNLYNAIKKCQYIMREDKIYSQTQNQSRFNPKISLTGMKNSYTNYGNAFPNINESNKRIQSAKGTRQIGTVSKRPISAMTSIGGRNKQNRLNELNRNDFENNDFYDTEIKNENKGNTPQNNYYENKRQNKKYLIEREEVEPISGNEFLTKLDHYEKVNREQMPKIIEEKDIYLTYKAKKSEIKDTFGDNPQAEESKDKDLEDEFSDEEEKNEEEENEFNEEEDKVNQMDEKEKEMEEYTTMRKTVKRPPVDYQFSGSESGSDESSETEKSKKKKKKKSKKK